MTYRRIKTIKGRQYVYEQESYRENGKVRVRQKYLGPLDRFLQSLFGNSARDGGHLTEEEMIYRGWCTHTEAQLKVIRDFEAKCKEREQTVMMENGHAVLNSPSETPSPSSAQPSAPSSDTPSSDTTSNTETPSSSQPQ